MSNIKFHDNMRVKTYKNGAEYFSISFYEIDEYVPYRVSLSRYCVPGRCDTYLFDYCEGGCGQGDRIRYFSEGSVPLPKTLQLLHADLDKPQVQKLIVAAVSEYAHYRYAREFVEQLLANLAPKSKALRLARKALAGVSKKVEEVRAARAAQVKSDELEDTV